MSVPRIVSRLLSARSGSTGLCQGKQNHTQSINTIAQSGFLHYDRLTWALQGDKVVLKVNKLTSTKTQLPYEYYSMPYCRPEKIMPSAENLGEVLRGDRIENSPYEVRSDNTLPIPAHSSTL